MHWAKCFGFMSMNVDLILLWKYFKSAFVFAVYSCEIESRLRSRFPFWVRDWYRLVSERDAECCQVQKDERSTVDDSALSMAWHRLVCHGLNSNQPLTQTLSFNAADSFAVYGLKRHFVRTHSRHGLTLPYCWSTLRTLNTPNNPLPVSLFVCYRIPWIHCLHGQDPSSRSHSHPHPHPLPHPLPVGAALPFWQIVARASAILEHDLFMQFLP